MNVQTAYPAESKATTGNVNDIPTEVRVTLFKDKILVTVSQDGRLAQWVQANCPLSYGDTSSLPRSQTHVPLDTPNVSEDQAQLPAETSDSDLLPMAHLTARTLLGASTPERETVGHLYATRIASAIATKDPMEKRTLVLGLGLREFEASREVFYDMMDLVLECL